VVVAADGVEASDAGGQDEFGGETGAEIARVEEQAASSGCAAGGTAQIVAESVV
jgi:hypothetical protein